MDLERSVLYLLGDVDAIQSTELVRKRFPTTQVYIVRDEARENIDIERLAIDRKAKKVSNIFRVLNVLEGFWEKC